MKLLSCTCVLLVTSLVSNAQQALPGTSVVNGGVSSITRGDGKIFLGGGFDWVGPAHGSGEAVFNSTLTYDDSYPRVGQVLRAAKADGAGGWYIANDERIVHLRPDKTIDDLEIDVDGYVGTLEIAGNILYIGGSFANINGVARESIAAFDLTSRELTSWNPNANGGIEIITASGTTIYAGGRFTSIGGQTRSRIAALDASTGLATSWNPAVATGSGFVRAIIVDGGTIYFGGGFSNVGSGSPARTNFATVNSTTGALLPFNPRPNSLVYNLLLDGNTMFMAGNFSEVAATPKDRFAVIDVTTGMFPAFAVTFNDYAEVTSLAIDGQKLFIGGTFTMINGENRPRLAVVNKTSGALEPMDAGKVSSAPYRLEVSDGKILAVADKYFDGVTGRSTGAHGVAALDEDTGEPVAWTAEMPSLAANRFPSQVLLHHQDNRVYFLEGTYDLLVSEYETRIGALDETDGSAVNTLELVVNHNVDAWAFSDNVLYLAGPFTEVNGVARLGFAAVDLTTGDLLPWTISFVPGENQVYSMMVHNNVLYVGGDFFYSDGSDRQNLAAWDATTGVLTDWAPEYFSDFGIPRIGAVTDTQVYIIGNGIYTVDATTGETGTGWLSLFNEAQLNTMAIHESEVYVGGYSQPEQTAMIARLDIATGEVSGAQPVLHDTYASEGSSVLALAVSETKLLAGGGFAFDLNGIRRPNYAEYLLSAPTGNSPPQIEATTATVSAEGTVVIDLQPLISDPDDNLDLSTIQLISELSEQGAPASLDGLTLTLSYEGLTFVGTDHISIRVCDLTGECAQQELTIEVTADPENVGDIVVYNAISPNGDEKNDFFLLEYIETFGENKVTIFNRWGDLVFNVSDYNNADRVFTGSNKNGNELPSGAYFYKIEYDGGNRTRSGYLILRR